MNKKITAVENSIAVIFFESSLLLDFFDCVLHCSTGLVDCILDSLGSFFRYRDHLVDDFLCLFLNGSSFFRLILAGHCEEAQASDDSHQSDFFHKAKY